MQVGHAGTLDPMATGLLIVCVGKATKLVDRSVYKPEAALLTDELRLNARQFVMSLMHGLLVSVIMF